ncbi:MAG TPA: hypothetical protein VFB62_15350 [Polyangiaceae bacterium]|nr:hypothetical protein [Polyangiaceae bacterium]
MGLVLATSIYVIVGPFLVSRYPMMTDLPFHAANAAILRHYFDPAWHFREQFVLQPFAVPYLSMYVIAALLMTFMSAVSAIKVAAVVMLALLPIGLAVLSWGMHKSPLLGVAGLVLVWGGLSSWGFLNFLGALGLFAMALGFALRGRAWAVSWVLVVLLFTHPFRFPFALAIAGGVLLFRRRRGIEVLALPAALFVVWWFARPPELSGDFGPLAFHLERLPEAGGHLYRSLRDPLEKRAADFALETLCWLGLGLAAMGVVERRGAPVPAVLVVAGTALVFLSLYLVLPMQVGVWWYVYPREITAAAFMALGVIPDLPRTRVLRVGAVVLLCGVMLPLGKVVIDSWRPFDAATRDFDAVVARLPRAPKLLYLVFDHTGSQALRTPFIHLPAYVQAERGGWLSFHFAGWGAAPVAYRQEGGVVPPPVPLRWEWTPQRFEVARNGAFFDWFLVRSQHAPSAIFSADPSIAFEARSGRWWLYRRKGSSLSNKPTPSSASKRALVTVPP